MIARVRKSVSGFPPPKILLKGSETPRATSFGSKLFLRCSRANLKKRFGRPVVYVLRERAPAPDEGERTSGDSDRRERYGDTGRPDGSQPAGPRGPAPRVGQKKAPRVRRARTETLRPLQGSSGSVRIRRGTASGPKATRETAMLFRGFPSAKRDPGPRSR